MEAIENAKKAIAAAPKNLREGQQRKHIVGTKEYDDYVKRLSDIGQFGPSRIYGGLEEAQRLVDEFSGKGEIKIKNGKWDNWETVLINDVPIGIAINNFNGVEQETSVFKIHYSEKYGTHIVPDYMSKKR